MPFVELAEWNGSPEVVAWKFLSRDISSKRQRIVNGSQAAFPVHGGVYESPFVAYPIFCASRYECATGYEVKLQARRVQSRWVEAMAMAAMAAVSARRMRGPRVTDCHWCWVKRDISSGVQPPSGPMARASVFVL